MKVFGQSLLDLQVLATPINVIFQDLNDTPVEYIETFYLPRAAGCLMCHVSHTVFTCYVCCYHLLSFSQWFPLSQDLSLLRFPRLKQIALKSQWRTVAFTVKWTPRFVLGFSCCLSRHLSVYLFAIHLGSYKVGVQNLVHKIFSAHHLQAVCLKKEGRKKKSM